MQEKMKKTHTKFNVKEIYVLSNKLMSEIKYLTYIHHIFEAFWSMHMKSLVTSNISNIWARFWTFMYSHKISALSKFVLPLIANLHCCHTDLIPRPKSNAHQMHRPSYQMVTNASLIAYRYRSVIYLFQIIVEAAPMHAFMASVYNISYIFAPTPSSRTGPS